MSAFIFSSLPSGLASSLAVHAVISLAVSAFFAILFLQSGLDKVIDWKGNLEFHSRHFAHSPFAKLSVILLILITGMEICCGLLAVTSLVLILSGNSTAVPFYTCCLASLNFLSLFLGQRISKDYAGAAALVPYFLLSLAGQYFSFFLR